MKKNDYNINNVLVTSYATIQKVYMDDLMMCLV